MTVLTTTVALIIIVFTLHDVMATVLSHHGAGPITSFWTLGVWRLILWMKYKRRWTLPIRVAGPGFLVAIVGVWYLLLNIAWFLLIYGGDYTIRGQRDTQMGALDIVYFISSTFATLGMGDYVPTRFPWTLVATSGALVVSLLTSLAISYIIPVLSALVSRRCLISAIDIIGTSPAQILERGWDGPHSGDLDSEVLNVSDGLVKESYQSHVYPVLSYFYFGDSHNSLNMAVLNLYDALSLQQFAPNRPGNISPPKLSYLLQAIASYISNLESSFLDAAPSLRARHDDFFAILERHNVDFGSVDRERLANTLTQRSNLLIYAYFEGRCRPDDDGYLQRY